MKFRAFYEVCMLFVAYSVRVDGMGLSWLFWLDNPGYGIVGVRNCFVGNCFSSFVDMWWYGSDVFTGVGGIRCRPFSLGRGVVEDCGSRSASEIVHV